MRLTHVLVVVLLSLVVAWSAEDREIFSLREAVHKDVGGDATFYDWLKVGPSATDAQIAKAYRRLSQKLHPDKNPSKAAGEKFARLGLVVKILRGPARDRYDAFLKHGFPRWKGTDYYYSRYRPGMGAVAVFLYLLVSFAQYWFLKLTAIQHRNHMSSVIAEAKQTAWPGGIPSSQRKVTLPSGKVFMVYPEGKVTLVDNSIEYPLRLEDIPLPTWRSTILFQWPAAAYYKVTGKTNPKGGQVLGEGSPDDNDESKKKDQVVEKKKTPRPATKVGRRRK